MKQKLNDKKKHNLHEKSSYSFFHCLTAVYPISYGMKEHPQETSVAESI